MSQGKHKLLIIDDDEGLSSTLQRVLEDAGFEAVTASNGYLGLLAVEQEMPSLVVTDILMPDRDGIETVLEAKRRWPNLKIIAMSGGGAFGDGVHYLHAAERLGADAILSKPFRPQQLLDLVREQLGGD